MTKQTIAKYEKVQKLIKKGVPVGKAIEQGGLKGMYYKVKRQIEGKSVKPKPQLFQVEVPQRDENGSFQMVVIRGDSGTVKEVARSIAEVFSG